MAPSVRDNKDRSRFELDVGSEIAFANYRLTPSAVIITHTETPRALRGRGIGSELVKGALELIRRDGRKVIAGVASSSIISTSIRKMRISSPECKRARAIAGPWFATERSGQCLISGGSLPPLAASLDITCLCSQTFMLAKSLRVAAVAELLGEILARSQAGIDVERLHRGRRSRCAIPASRPCLRGGRHVDDCEATSAPARTWIALGAAPAGALPAVRRLAGAAEAGWLPKIAPIIFPKMLMSAPRKGPVEGLERHL